MHSPDSADGQSADMPGYGTPAPAGMLLQRDLCISQTSVRRLGCQRLLDLKVYPSSITIPCERYQLEAKGATLVGFPRLIQSYG